MTDIQYNTIRKYMLSLCLQWRSTLGLYPWNLTFEWSRELFSHDTDGHPSHCVAHCTANWRYLEATITFALPTLLPYFAPSPTNPKSLVPKDPNRLRYIVLHELMHIFLNELRVTNDKEAEVQISHEEHTATLLAQAFAYTYDFAHRKAIHTLSQDSIKSKKGPKSK